MKKACLIGLLFVLFGCRTNTPNSGEVMKAFVNEFYSGRAHADLTAVVEKYTLWPNFAVGDAKQIATSQDIRLVTENSEEAQFEVRFKVIGEESRGQVELGKTDVIQTYRMRRRRGEWRILEPIQFPCISVEGELTRLRAQIEKASDQTLISNAQASIALLESYH